VRGAGEQGEQIMRGLVFGAAALVAWTGTALGQDVEAGARSFRKCSPCHAVGENAKSVIGPTLNGLDGRKAGAVADFSYSDANKNADIVWSEATFKDYIQNPQAKIPATKMLFAGVKDEQEIADLWAYLKQFGPDGGKK
jgi:cytochrome c